MYKRYLWDPNVKIPRCTRLKWRRQAEARRLEQVAWEEEQNRNQNGAQEFELHNPALSPSSFSVSSSSENENTNENLGESVEVPNPRGKRARKRPVSEPLVIEEGVSCNSSESDHTDNQSQEAFSEEDSSTDSTDEHDRDNQIQESSSDEDSSTDSTDEHEHQETIIEENQAPRETICPCSNLTSDDVVIMVLTLAIRHSMSWAAQVDVLNLVNTIYKTDKVPDTKHLYRKRIGHKLPRTTCHVYCTVKQCSRYLGNKDDLEETVTCECKQVTNVKETQKFFVSLSLQDQFEELFQKENVVKSLFSYRFNREIRNPNNYEDIYDGALYKKHFLNNGILSNPHNFSYSFNTDGMPVGKSSNRTLWPIYLTINELPPEERERHVILAGLYCGDKDPNQAMFLTPFVQQANELSSVGFTWNFKGSVIKSLVIPMCAVVDSVARFQMLNMSSFHGTNGCTFCYHKSVHTRKGQKYTIRNEPAALRTRKSTIGDIKEAFKLVGKSAERDRMYNGVKGPSALLDLNYFHIISGFVPDYMHAILQGVIRTHMDLLFETTRKKFWIGMTDQIAMEHVINALDERLLTFAPPKIVTRLPRSLHERANWKASEWRGWLVLYCIPCLQGILKRKHVNHLALLSTAVSLLLSRSISAEDVSKAKELLLRYVFLFQKYFGEENMVYNCHLLLHVSDQILNWGPLYAHNCFLYEGQNRLMLKMYHSPNQVVKQLVCKFLTYGSLQSLVCKFGTTKEALTYCEDILSCELKKVAHVANVRLVGTGKAAYLTEEEEEALLRFKNFDDKVQFYDSMFFRKCKFTTYTYVNNKKCNNAFVLVSGNKFGHIRRIFTDGQEVYVLIKCFEVHKVQIDDSQISKTYLHLNSVTGERDLFVTLARKIRNVAMFLETTEGIYICEIPFGCWSGF